MASSKRRSSAAFSLVELLVAITIAGLLLTVSVSFGVRFYDSMQYRDAVRTVLGAFMTSRQRAVASGLQQDVVFFPDKNTVAFAGETEQLSSNVNLAVRSAAGLSNSGGGVIRFYPEGGATGGDVELESDSGRGVRISVDWLTGKVTQESYGFD